MEKLDPSERTLSHRMSKLFEILKGHRRTLMTRKQQSAQSLLKRLRWFHLPLSFAVTLLLLGQVRKFRRKNGDDNAYKPLPFEVSMYRMLPLRTLSRMWGWINSLELPQPVRIPILKSYAAAFGCDINEAFIEDLAQYKNLNEFFRRELKPGLRPIAGSEHDVVSPCDGKVLHMGQVQNGLLEQVKGITYTIESFLGPITWKSCNNYDQYEQCLLQHNDTDLYHCVIYLAPGDYHRFHSPVNWTVKYRRHFPGKLYSVRPTFASWFPNLFSVNERVAYVGEWQYGFFAMVPVGATNVGSMRIYFDPDLRTNRTQMSLLSGRYEDKQMNDKQIHLRKGDPFGEFNLGSTIVLIFEAPKAMRFQIHQEMKIKYGQLIGVTKK
uniref:Phosphatidylserine decarboxylase proenzyme, mitochondrial n=1 Tax=Dermatophagoides pteronyssinus TaxID=6956 RepID=A0A6P6YA99_DERPT|nr:phosphatidylserine decarboxylase proenzyme, mitochondrial-like isoform X2 [Dermatophagoides pteronyssinus]